MLIISARRTLDVDPTGNIALVAQVGGRAHLVSVGPNGDGKIQQVYCIKDEELVPKLTHEFGALFANQGQTVLFGSMSGCVLAWDKEKANVLCVLDHCEGKESAPISCGVTENLEHVLRWHYSSDSSESLLALHLA